MRHSGYNASAVGPVRYFNVAQRKALLDALNAHFGIEELKSVVFGLGLDFDNLAGETKEAKAAALIEKCERFGIVDELISTIREERANAF